MFAFSVGLALLSATAASAQITGTFPATPLASKTSFTYPSGIPEQVDTDTQLIRGPQFGYNICNSTTEGPTSLCQTSFLNSLDDFCLWAPSDPNSVVADREGEMVAWCTKPGRGTRLIPAGALTGVQFMKTPDYVQVVGFVNQQLIDLAPDDFGGEMDPHGADLRGNPLGGIIFSNGFGGANGQFTQVIEWHNFMGGNAFCFKACDPKGPRAAQLCQHIYDRIGCSYNAPNNAQNGTFESCQGDSQDPVGVYTSNGAVVTYTQPAESLGAITSIPYTARVPASSNCVSQQSSALYAALPAPTGASSAASSASAASSGAAASGSRPAVPTASGSATRSGSAATASNTSSDASTLAISGVSILGVVFASLFLS